MNLALLLKNKAFSCLSNSVRISVIHTRFENGEKDNIFNGLSCYLNGHSVRFVRLSGYYGHKICLTGGTSNLILDYVILEGNPADSSLTEMMLDRQETIYGRYPLKAAFDGGFSSQENPKKAKEKKGLKEVCFSKSRGLDIKDMCRSSWMFKQLRNFRAGIESGISWLKRSLGLNRCLWKGFESFKSYVWASIVSANLLTMARHQWA